MIVYRIARKKYARDLSGEGAFRVGGRWNSPGTRLLYTSLSVSTAFLEILVHTEGIPFHHDLTILTIEIPDEGFTYNKHLPDDWDRVPSNSSSARIGDLFVHQGKHLFMKVPSVLFPEDKNVLINPTNELAHNIEVINARNFKMDRRLLKYF